jgi:hypothetical protein
MLPFNVIFAQKNIIWGTFLNTEKIRHGLISRCLIFKSDSFTLDLGIGGPNNIIHGNYLIAKDTINLYYDKYFFGKLCKDSKSSNLRCLYLNPAYSLKTVGDTVSLTFHKVEYCQMLTLPDSEKSFTSREEGRKNYTLIYRDSFSRTVCEVEVINGFKEGIQDTFPDPEIHCYQVLGGHMLVIKEYKSGRWHRGHKAGIWRTYNKKGAIITKEKWSYKKGLIWRRNMQ